MEIVKDQYDCVVIIGQNIYEVPSTNRETLIKQYTELIETPVGERKALFFPGRDGNADCIFDPNVPGITVQVMSMRDFKSRQAQMNQQRARAAGPQIALPGRPPVGIPRGRG